MQVITGGAQTFDALVYANDHPGNHNYFAQQFQNMGQNLTDVGQSFFAGAQALYDRFQGSDAMRIAKATARKVASIWDRDDIRALVEIGKIQHAKSVNQRWIMAEPTYRTKYHAQLCDGFSDSYVDYHPGQVGDQHHDWKRVMDGLLVEDAVHGWKISCYGDELYEGEVEPNLDEKNDILTTWDFVEHYTKLGKEDPGSVWACNF